MSTGEDTGPKDGGAGEADFPASVCTGIIWLGLLRPAGSRSVSLLCQAFPAQ